MKLLFDNGIYPEPEPVLPYASLLQSNWLKLWWWWQERKIPKNDRWVYERMLPHLGEPTRVQGWMYSHLQYNAWDIFDTWMRPENLFYKTDRGDCEDWSIFAAACLKRKHYGYLVLMFRKQGDIQYGHASYATRWSINPDKWISLGTFGLQYHTGTWKDIVEDHSGYNKWTKIIVLDAMEVEKAYGTDYVDRSKLEEVYRVER